jgi:hypothetical protein
MSDIGNFDPRSAWDHARRMELVRHANDLGYKDITEQMPKELIVRRLQALGAPPPNTPLRPLQPIGGTIDPRTSDTHPGSHKNGTAKQIAASDEIDATELLEQEFASQNANKSYNEMRAELKAAGVKLDRRWNKEAVKAEWEKLK